MKSFLKISRRALSFLFRFTLICAAAFALVAAFHDVELPAAGVDSICRRLSCDEFALRADRATFNLIRGLRIENLRLLDRKHPAVEPVAKAESIEIGLTLRRIPWRLARMVKSVRATRLVYRRLPEWYYIPNSVLHPGQSDYLERDRPLELALPLIRRFRLDLVEPDILGVRPARLTAPACEISPRGVFIPLFAIDWPDDDTAMQLTGAAEFNLADQKVRCELRGLARQRHIRPLLEALDVPCSFPYIDGFTGVTAPVKAAANIEVNLTNNDFGIKLDLEPGGGFYNGVAFTRAAGKLDISNRVRGTNFEFRVLAGPIEAEFPGGGQAKASIEAKSEKGELAVSVEAESNAMKIKELLALADILNDGTLDCLESDCADVGIKGVIHPYAPERNDLSGRVAFKKGSLFGVPLADASCRFHEIGPTVFFTNASARASGGAVTGAARIDCPDFKEELATFSVALEGKKLALRSLAETFSIASEDRDGMVDGRISLSGPLSTNLASRLEGGGSFATRNGHLSRINLFMGFTDWMSRNVPGISSIVDQSSASADFTIRAGVIESKNLSIEGNVFSVRGEGTYSIPEDRVDAKVHARLCRSGSIVGMIVQPLTSPLLKALFEFHVSGTIAEPEWSYISPIDRLTGGAKENAR